MQLRNIGKSLPNKKSASPHSHACWELIYNTNGNGMMTLGDQTASFAKGTVALCPPGMIHDKNAKKGFTDYYVNFDGCDLPLQTYVLQDSYDQRLLQLIQVLHAIYYEETAPSICDSLLDVILGLIKPMLLGAEQSQYVRMLRDAIIDGFTDPDFTVRNAVNAIPLNADHLRRRFKAELGMTPSEYLIQLRMEYAKKRLSQEPRLSVTEVAFRAGYYDPLYFSRSFKKYTGVSPANWK